MILNFKKLNNLIKHINVERIPFSRIHPLKENGHQGLQCFVKRDDELGGGVGGAKVRKYLSLIQYINTQKISHAIVIGGRQSNNVLALMQLLIENNVNPFLFLLKGHETEIKGNFLLTSLFIDNNIQWIDRNCWMDVETYAFNYAQKNFHKEEKFLVIPEGACMSQSLPGALTLPIDIIHSRFIFDHIFIEAGTGLMAIALLLVFSYMLLKTKIHIVLLADNEELFLKKLKKFLCVFNKLLNVNIPFPENFCLYKPEVSSQSFGGVNQKIFDCIQTIAIHEGFLTDPIYSAKLFLEAENIIKKQALKGKALIIHSGVANTLLGFEKFLLKTIEKKVD